MMKFIGIIFVLCMIDACRGLPVSSNYTVNGCNETETEPDLCLSRICIQAAHDMLINIDETVDPCEDFYSFSCGGFIKNRRIPDYEVILNIYKIAADEAKFKMIDLLEQEIDANDTYYMKNAKKYYKSCSNEEVLDKIAEDKLRQFISENICNWPNTSNKDCVSKISTMKVGRSGNVDFSCESQVNAYKTYIKTVLGYLYPQLNESVCTEIAKDIILFDNFTDNNIPDANENIRAFRKFDRRKSSFYAASFDIFSSIVDYFEENFSNTTNEVQNDIKMTDLMKLKSAKLNLISSWRLISEYVDFLPLRYQLAKFEFHKIIYKTKGLVPRDLTCLDDLSYKLPLLVSRIYFDMMNQTYSEFSTIPDVIDRIKNELRNVTGNIKWMDTYSLNKTFEMIEKMEHEIGNHYDAFNETLLEIHFGKFEFDENDFVNNQKLIYNLYSNHGYLIFNNYHSDAPFEMNAFFHHGDEDIESTLLISSGLLNYPFSSEELPSYFNYGRIGYILAHEVVHGFTCLSDFENCWNKWSEETNNNYEPIKKCLVNQYSGYESETRKIKLDGEMLLEENLADNGAIKIGFKAYKKYVSENGEDKLLPGVNYNQDQLYFINMAQLWCEKINKLSQDDYSENDKHSPRRFRVIGPASNSAEFAKAFNCKTGTKQNPDKKCSAW